MKTIIADPAGNTTAFIFDAPEDKAERLALCKKLLEGPSQRIEQVGFVSNFPEKPTLMMMGGEFCGNATRSLGLLAAKEQGIKGKAAMQVICSGAKEPVPVNVDTEKSFTEASMPLPLGIEELSQRTQRTQRSQLVVFSQGITHIIVTDSEANEKNFYAIKSSLCSLCLCERNIDALGVMFYNPSTNFMQPVVWVTETDSLVFESSCGSGTAALMVYAAQEMADGEKTLQIRQPGGTLQGRIVKKGGRIEAVYIGGTVGFSSF
ncbi:MAG: hypothetical protein LBM77_00365 [Spirochaetaceae bacterium]|jgi:diaminopimelate epimerase|nr:hypothetical protein [Spirochaetaceae bacterium]